MRAFAWVFVFKKCRAIEFGERPFVARKMRGNPIHNHADAGFVQGVDEKLKIFRRAE